MTAQQWEFFTESNRRVIWEELSCIIDPEIGVSITDLDLIDEVLIDGGKINVTFHLTMPYCPAPFAVDIAAEIKERLSAIPGINKVVTHINDHILADEINRQVNDAA